MGPMAFITMVAASATNGSPGTGPKPPNKVAKYDAKPKNMPGTKLSAGMRPSDIMVAFRQNRMMHCAATKAPPLKCCPATLKPSTIRQAKIEPIGIVSQIFFNTSGFGPPAAKVPAQDTKIAHGGRFDGVNTVVAASREATISAGSFFMALSFRVSCVGNVLMRLVFSAGLGASYFGCGWV